MRVRAILVVTAVALSTATFAMPAEAGGRPERYIVVLRDGAAETPDAAADYARGLGGNVHHVYRHALHGFAATLPEAAVEKLRERPTVESVQLDGVVRATATQVGPPWGLDRIDQRLLPLSNTFTYTATGTGVTAYVIDTGIRFSHADFGGRAVSGFDAVDGGTADDCDGHGTHVAGTIGGTTYGVAKNVRLVAVRVLDCWGNGLWSWVIAGVDWVTGDHDPGEPAVANMSLAGWTYEPADAAVSASIADGVSYSVAAANAADDACNYTPARVPEAMTLGATDRNDNEAWFSNYGPCVDWYAPGVDVPSAYHTGDTATAVLSGTSMASPHNAGVAAQYLQTNPTASPLLVSLVLNLKTTRGVVIGLGAAFGNNNLLFTDL